MQSKKIRKLLNIIFIILLAVSLCFNFFTYRENTELSQKYESLMCFTSQLDSKNVISFLCSISTNEYKDIEIFDISQGKIVKKLQSNEEIQNNVLQFVKDITGLYVNVKPFPEAGYIMRVPINPPVQVENQWVQEQGVETVNELYLLFPKEDEPFILILNDENRPFFFKYKGDTKSFLKEIGIE